MVVPIEQVNTAARMEHTGMPNRIQLSSFTAELIIKAGKGHWVQPREETVFAKGKGEMSTYWLVADQQDKGHDETTSCSSIVDFDEGILEAEITKSMGSLPDLPTKTMRLVEWNTEVLLRLLKQIVAMRSKRLSMAVGPDQWNRSSSQGNTVLSEVQEVIQLPGYKKGVADVSRVFLDDEIQRQLRTYVASIASHYPPNPFHNFEHASHVCSVRICWDVCLCSSNSAVTVCCKDDVTGCGTSSCGRCLATT